MYIIVYEKLYRICYCIWGNAWFVSMEKISIFYLIFGNEFCRLIALFAKFKNASIFGKIDTKSGQNGQIPHFLEIFSKKTLFRK